MERKRYVATVNVPGYLPQADEPAVFDTPQEAWQWLHSERERDEDHAADDGTGEYSDTWRTLGYIAEGEHEHGNPHEDTPTEADGTGSVWGSTPGSDSEHDLGLVYAVAEMRHNPYPHEPGRLHDCAACESYCWCDGVEGHTECIHCGGVDTGEWSCDGESCGSTSH